MAHHPRSAAKPETAHKAAKSGIRGVTTRSTILRSALRHPAPGGTGAPVIIRKADPARTRYHQDLAPLRRAEAAFDLLGSPSTDLACPQYHRIAVRRGGGVVERNPISPRTSSASTRPSLRQSYLHNLKGAKMRKDSVRAPPGDSHARRRAHRLSELLSWCVPLRGGMSWRPAISLSRKEFTRWYWDQQVTSSP